MKPAAIGIVFNKDQTEVLLVRRKDVPIWVLPGGGIDEDESAEEAAIREVKEETGFDVEIIRQSGEYTPVNRLAAKTFAFICSIQGGSPMLTSETSGIHFFPLNNLPSSFFDVHLQWLQDAITHSTTVHKPLSGITYRHVLKYLFRHPWYTLRYLYTRLFKK